MDRGRAYRTGAENAASSPADRLGQRQTVVNEDDVHDEQDAEPAEDQHHQDDAAQHHVGRHDVRHRQLRVSLYIKKI